VTETGAESGPPVPRSFFEYLKSFGPGLVIALTWLGASDLVNSAVAGASYGYALMWALVVSLLARFAFVNIIAKYELCNERGETLMAGLVRIHKSVPLVILFLTLLLSHLYGSYLIRGIGEATHKLTFDMGQPWMWSLAWVAATFFIVFVGGFKTTEKIFYVFLAILSLVFIGIALWVGPSPIGILKGVFLFKVPPTTGKFEALLVVVALIGAMAGSIPNLLYPYFIRQKGWNGPRYRRVQTYDLMFGVLVMIVLDLAVWIVAAEVLHPKGMQISNVDELANLFVMVVGPIGAPLFHAGLLSIVATTIIGCAMGFGCLSQDIVHKLKHGPQAAVAPAEMKNKRTYRLVVTWFLITPLIWTIPSMPGFVPLTIGTNVIVVMTIPIVAGILWYLTASSKYIGAKYQNNAWENLTMGLLFALAAYGTWQAIASFT
jgi:Mn2+/Fe2+ NRAMP family transporter